MSWKFTACTSLFSSSSIQKAFFITSEGGILGVYCRSTFSKRAEFLNGVSQTACSVRDGYGAIAHCKELVQATWLEAGGHKYDVGTSNDPVRNLHREAYPTSALKSGVRNDCKEPISNYRDCGMSQDKAWTPL